MSTRSRSFLPNTPVLPAVLTLFVAICISFFYARAHNFNLSAFVQAGTELSNPNVLGPDFVVKSAGGSYDGQFYYRLSLEPWTTQRVAHGVTLDVPAYRQQRILYPLIVWCLSLGHQEWVPTVMVGVNILALTLIGWLGGLWSLHLKRHAAWGLLLPFHLGFTFSLCMDLAEIMQMCLLLAALLMWTQRRFLLVGILLSLSVLTKETSLLFAVAGAMTYGWERFRCVETKHQTVVPVVFVLPLAVYALCQIVMHQIWGQWPLLAGEHNLGLPFVGVGHLISQTLQSNKSDRASFSILILSQLWAIFILVITASRQLFKMSLPRPLVVAWTLYAALGACLSYTVMSADVNFQRGLSELIILCFLFLLACSTVRLRWYILCFQIFLVSLRLYILI